MTKKKGRIKIWKSIKATLGTLKMVKHPDKRYLFGFIECDTIFSGDFSTYGIVHTISNVLKLITILLLVSPNVNWWVKIGAMALNGLMLWYNVDTKEMIIKLW